MNKLLSILAIILFISCSTKEDNKSETIKKDHSLSVIEGIQNRKIEKSSISNEILNYSPDLIGFQKLINSLDRKSLNSISISKDFIKTRLPDSVKISDSLYYSYLKFFYSIVNTFNDTLYEQYAYLIPELEQNMDNDETKDFNKMIDNSGMILLMSEGYFYIDSKPDYFYNLFNSRLSPSLTEYLTIRRKELKEGF
ncbi:MAG: hypothetical protein K9H64_18540 [Bacteroidales bacterium]|nr:hypothetical protein [Bacteroidales bacterium]MCF8458051.1 hypothetical protein [Bacteroidales bacterium]